jgi:hypothetical protein
MTAFRLSRVLRGHWELFSQGHGDVEDAAGDFEFGGFRDFDCLVGGDDGYGVAVGVEADVGAGDFVEDDSVDALFCQLLAGVFEAVFGFGGKADQDVLVEAGCAEFGEDVGVRFEFERDGFFPLDLLGRRFSDTAAALITTVASGKRSITASRICWAVSTGMNSAPEGGLRAVGPLTRMTRAPRRMAASAMA